jgi:Metallo-peptidase family M12B Reprolysin-like/Secretion system C-terminal sorting domain
MRKTSASVLLISLLFLSAVTSAQNWQTVSESSIQVAREQHLIKPQKFVLQQLEPASLITVLNRSPKEFSAESRNNPNIIVLPMPDGSLQRFRVTESPVMEPGLAARFSEIKTYAAQGIDDPYATARLDYNPYFGFSAQILSVKGNVYIDPYARGNIDYYMSYYSKDYSLTGDPFICSVPDNPLNVNKIEASSPCRGTQLFTYRLALACTGEYAVAVCSPSAPTVPVTLAAMTTSVNRVSGVYENELSVRLLLVANNNLLVYLDGATDPYTNNNGNTMLGQNQTNVDLVIGSANYDIGHVFSTGGGGIAYLGVVCNNSFKAGGVTGRSVPLGDAFDIDYVAHEMGHQFGGDHSFNSNTGFCGGGNRNGPTAYEVGSATTIMGYAGICGSDDIQPNSDPFFHVVSYDEIGIYITSGGGNSCKQTIATGNTIPVITAMNNNGVTIPELTPFVLTASATDADADPLTYCWEEWDLGNQDTWDGGASSLDKPLFKSRVPKTTGTRMIPDINVILAGYPANPAATMGGLKGETLSDPNGSQTRTIKFKLTVRDNRSGGGGIATGGGDATSPGCSLATPFSINVKGGTGAFAITIPNGGENWLGGTTQTVTWNVASTNASPINTSNVNILMSTDGGLTYPTTVLAGTPNDGTQAFTIPNIPTNTTVRFMVQAVGNIFFDISNANFTITFNGTLPAGLIDFTAKAINGKIVLNWTTVFEQNNRGFEVQRSVNMADAFVPIGFVNGTGNSFSNQQYSFTDNTVQKNVRYYYRLKQVDIDNRSTYSPVRSVIISDSKLANITLAPNPVVDKLFITLNQNKIHLLTAEVFDVSGKLLMQRRFVNPLPLSVLEVNIPELSSGVYILRLISGEDQEAIRFIKQ